MYCPFLKTNCYDKCAFRHIPRQTTGSLQNQLNTCALAIAADELDQYLQMKIKQEEDQNS